MDAILPDRALAQQRGWTHQVQWIEGGKPCFSRFTTGQGADYFADSLHRSIKSKDVQVIDLRHALQLQ